MRLKALLALVPLAACSGDEALRGYTDKGAVWTLAELHSKPFTATATLGFAQKGRITGQAPCNRYSAEMKTPYPWFKVGPILSTRMLCPDLAAETAFFNALGDVTLSETSDTVLILSNPEGLQMVFKPAD